jgi:hypothetical protein
MEDAITLAARTNSRRDSVLVAQGIMIERTRVDNANEWLLDGLLLHAADMEKRGASFMDVDFIRTSVRRLRITTC